MIPPTQAALTANPNDPGTFKAHRGSHNRNGAQGAQNVYWESVAAFEQRSEEIIIYLRDHIPVS